MPEYDCTRLSSYEYVYRGLATGRRSVHCTVRCVLTLVGMEVPRGTGGVRYVLMVSPIVGVARITYTPKFVHRPSCGGTLS
jgi:hypothetical protein